MKYLDKLIEGKMPPKRINKGEGDSAGNPGSDEYVRGGKTGTPTTQGRLLKGRTKKASPSADVRVSNYTAGPKKKLPEHIEYKRMAALMAESLGYELDEAIQAALAPIGAGLARGAAVAGRVAGQAAKVGAKAAGSALKATGKVAGRALKAGAKATGDAAKSAAKSAGNMAKDAAIDMAEKRAKKMAAERMKEKGMELRQGGMEESFYFEMGMLIAEVTKKVGPIASQYSGMGRVKDKGKGKGAQAIKDPVVRSTVRKANKRVGEKLGIKANLKTDVAAQQGLENRRRRFRKKGIGLPRETPDIAKADAREDQKRRQAPDDE